jgi:hypothetical protein
MKAKHTFEMVVEFEIEGNITQRKFYTFVKNMRAAVESPVKDIKINKSVMRIRPSQFEFPTDKTVKLPIKSISIKN